MFLRKLRRPLLGALVLSGLVLAPAPSPGAGLPEPGLVLYGVIRNLDGRVPSRMTSGALTCRITAPGGQVVSLATNLQNINDQFSYVLLAPFETDIGSGVSSNTFALPASSLTYTQEFFLANAPVRAISTRTFTFSRTDRSRPQRVDADFSVAFPDANGNGLPDWWESQFFGGNANPTADPDHDGASNLAEYLAGTDPTSGASVFAFIEIRKSPAAGLIVDWSSSTNRSYRLERSTDLLSGFSAIQTNLPASPPRNTYEDSTATGPGPYFYRLRVE